MKTEHFASLPQLNRLESRVVATILEQAHLSESMWVPITLRQFERETKLSHVSVIQATKSLKTRNLIEVQFRTHKNKGNIYRLRANKLALGEAQAILQGKLYRPTPSQWELQTLIFQHWTEVVREQFRTRVQGYSYWTFDPENFRPFFWTYVWPEIASCYLPTQVETFYWELKDNGQTSEFLDKLPTPLGSTPQ